MMIDLTTCSDLRHLLGAWAQATPLTIMVNGTQITSASLVSAGHDGVVLSVEEVDPRVPAPEPRNPPPPRRKRKAQGKKKGKKS